MLLPLGVVSVDEVAAAEAEQDATDKALFTAAADAGATPAALDSHLALELGKLAYEVGLLKANFFAQGFEGLLANVGDFACLGPAGDGVAHRVVGQVVAFCGGGPAAQHAAGVTDRGAVFGSLRAGRRADQADHRQAQQPFVRRFHFEQSPLYALPRRGWHRCGGCGFRRRL